MGLDHNPQPYTLKKEKTFIWKLIPFLIPFLVFSVLAIVFFSGINDQKDDHELMEELIQKNKWASITHLSAVLRLCEQGNKKACAILEEYPEHRNIYIPRISGAKTNKKLVDLYNANFTKSEVSRPLYNVLTDKYTDLDGIFEAGLKQVKKVKGMTDNLIQETKWLLLEYGYDPTEWLER